MKTEINPSPIELKNKSFYWVKCFSSDTWEIGRYNKETDSFKFTNGSRKSDIVYEIGKEVVYE